MALPYESIARGRYGQAFVDKVHHISDDLGIKPEWLMEVMHSESGLQHSIRNHLNAVGFIQFLPSTARFLGTSPDGLANMGGVAQLDYVHKFYSYYRGKYKTPSDLYTAAFYPYAVGREDSYVVGSERGNAASVRNDNKPFDLNSDGQITLGEFRAYVRKKFKNLPDSDFEPGGLGTKKIAIITIIVILAISIALYFFRKEIANAYKAGFAKIKGVVN